LLVKEKWAIVLTGIAVVCYRHGADAPVLYFVPRPQPACRCVRFGVVVVSQLD
jgi:hypothetical protein